MRGGGTLDAACCLGWLVVAGCPRLPRGGGLIAREGGPLDGGAFLGGLVMGGGENCGVPCLCGGLILGL